MRTTIKLAALLILAAVLLPGRILAQADTSGRPSAPRLKMTRYYLVLLRSGPAPASSDKAVNDAIFQGHMANIRRLADEGKMIVAGPVSGAEKLEGIFVLRADSLAEAWTLVNTDPAVKANRLTAEILTWYAPAGLKVHPETLAVRPVP